MIEPKIDELLEHVDSKYTLVILAARRARQINGYAQLGEGIGEYVPPMVDAGPNRKASRSPSRRSSRTSWSGSARPRSPIK